MIPALLLASSLLAGSAMAAPAAMPEFKGNVAAVRTEKYWDPELGAARAKDNSIRQQAKKLAASAKLKPADIKAAIMGSAVPTPSLQGKVVTGGRLNASGF